MESVEVTSADIARLAGVRPTAVSNWRRRHADFPQPVGGTEKSPRFLLADVRDWLQAQGKSTSSPSLDRLEQAVTVATATSPLADTLRNLMLALAYERQSARADREAWRERLEAAREELLDRHPGLLVSDVRTEPLRLDDAQAAMLNTAAEVLAEDAAPDLGEALYDAARARLHKGDTATPAELGDLLVELCGPPAGPLLDPACGAGTILLSAGRRGWKGLYGQEKIPSRAELTALRLDTAGLDKGCRSEIHLGNALLHNPFGNGSCAAVASYLPFNDRTWSEDAKPPEGKWPYGIPSGRESELAWVQLALSRLRDDGTAVLVMPPAAANRTTGRRIRRALVSAGVVRAVIALPRGTLQGTALAPHLWILQPEHAQPRRRILMADYSTWSGPRDQPQWQKIGRDLVGSWNAFRQDEQADLPRGSAFTVRAADVLDEYIDLTPSRHRPLEAAFATDPARTRQRQEQVLTATVAFRDHLASLSLESLEPGTEPAWDSIEALESKGNLNIYRGAPPGRPVDGLTRTVRLAYARPSRRESDGEEEIEIDAGLQLPEIQEGDILASVIGGSISVRLAETGDLGSVPGRGTVVVRTNLRSIEPAYLAGFLASGAARRQITPSTTSMGTNTVRELRGLRIPVPDLERQRRHAAVFTAAERLETEAAQLYAATRDLAERYRMDTLALDIDATSPIPS